MINRSRVGWMASAVIACTAPVVAQPVPGGPFVEIDPVPVCERLYVDPVNGNDSNPGTLANPLQTLSTAMNIASPPSVIILEPGQYSTFTGESFPIFCRDDVSIQGTNALNTVIHGDGNDVLWIIPFGINEDYETTSYDGFTIKGADAAVRFIDELVCGRPTFSNMFVVENSIGFSFHAIDLAGDPSPCDRDGNGFIEFRPRLVNLTIANNEFGIFDTSTNSTGEAEPSILNCLIYQNTVDLEGVDGDDLAFTDFCVANTGLSIPNGPPAVSHQLICGTPASSIFINAATNDYRQLPTALTIDQGSETHLVFHGTDRVRVNFPCGQKLWDADCEGYCDARVAGGRIDIGADELGEGIIAGYMPNTTDFGTDSTGTVYNVAQIYVTPQPAPGGTLQALVNIGITPNLGYLKWLPTTVPGARPRGTTTPTPRPPFGDLCIDPATLIAPLTITPAGWGVPVTMPITLPAGTLRWNVQLLPFDTSGVFATLTNLQSMRIGP